MCGHDAKLKCDVSRASLDTDYSVPSFLLDLPTAFSLFFFVLFFYCSGL